ncbi:GNAT family N-acetyltransferase [Gemmatimonadota bacterium]
MEDYPKTLELTDGIMVTLELLNDNDLDQLIKFFQRLPEKDRLYLRSDITNPENVRRRFGNPDYDSMFPVIGRVNGEIMGIATIFRASFGWMRNLGEVRICIAPEFQKRGLSTLLVRELFFQALKMDIYKLQVELMDTQNAAITAFKHLGFREEAILPKHVTDIKGVRRDLVIMTLDVEDLWAAQEDMVQTRDFRMH